jgi:hypothetical protein
VHGEKPAQESNMKRLLGGVVFLFLCLPWHLRAQTSPIFFEAPSFSGGEVSADFNQDDKPDIIKADGTVLLGNGDGTFTTGVPLTVTGNMAVGDFNGDGKPDLVISSSNLLYVLLGNGDGTFRTAITTNIGTTLGSLAVADFNGDGKADVIGLTGASVLVLLGHGDGTFASGVAYPLSSNSGGALALGDFNGDGKIDFLEFGSGTNTAGPLQVFLGKGDGAFQAPINATGVLNPNSVVVRDFNGDGKADLAVSDAGAAETFIFLGNGDGTFQTPGAPIAASGDLAVADLNGDGKTDLLVAGDTSVGVFLGKGDGTFALKENYFIGLASAATIFVADFNGDGKLDVAVRDVMLFGNGDGTFQGDLAFIVPGGNIAPGPGVAADFNGDGNPDIAIITETKTDTVLLSIFLGDGTGKFTLAHTYTLPVLPVGIASADLNGDGKTDLLYITIDPITVKWSYSVLLGNGDGSFGSPVTSAPQGDPEEPVSVPFALADVNADHIPDLVAVTASGLSVYLGKGDGTFNAPTNYFIGSVPSSVVVGDFNNDGKVDLAATNASGIAILFGNGNGTFQAANFYTSPLIYLQDAVDLNGDGNLDLVGVVNANGGNVVEVSLGNGDGTFTALAPTNLNVGLQSLAIADVNGDGKLDLLASTFLSGVQLALGNGDGTFGNAITILPPGVQFFGGPGNLIVADFNRDGRPDIVVPEGGTNTNLVVLLNITGPPTPDFTISTSGLSPNLVAPGSTASTTVTIQSVGGFSGNVALSCDGLPTGATCNFAPASVPGGSGTSKLTIKTTASTPLGSYPVLISAASTITHERVLNLVVATSAGATTVTLAPQTLTFPVQATGTTSPAQTVTLTNTGTATLTISGISITGSNAGDFAETNTCGASQAAGASCLISVTYSPTAMGNRTAAISVSDNATGSPQMVSLTGAGPDFTVAPATTASMTVAPGATATYTISVAPSGGFNQMIAFTCSGAPAMSTCTVTPSTLSLSGTAAGMVSVKVATIAASQVLPLERNDRRPRTNWPKGILLELLGTAMLAGWWLQRREQQMRWVPVLPMVALLCVGLTLTSCSSGGNGGAGGGGGGSTGTQAGTYTLTVTGTVGSSALTHSTQLTLVVQ